MFPWLYFAISVGSYSHSYSKGPRRVSVLLAQTFGHFHPPHIQQRDIPRLGLGNSWLSIFTGTEPRHDGTRLLAICKHSGY